jgi:hypothetical protein
MMRRGRPAVGSGYVSAASLPRYRCPHYSTYSERDESQESQQFSSKRHMRGTLRVAKRHKGFRDRRKLTMNILVATLIGVVVVIWPTRAYGKGRERGLDGDAVPETRNPTACAN